MYLIWPCRINRVSRTRRTRNTEYNGGDAGSICGNVEYNGGDVEHNGGMLSIMAEAAVFAQGQHPDVAHRDPP
eukprot:1907035-Rhodomonas_salina.1